MAHARNDDNNDSTFKTISAGINSPDAARSLNDGKQWNNKKTITINHVLLLPLSNNTRTVLSAPPRLLLLLPND